MNKLNFVNYNNKDFIKKVKDYYIKQKVEEYFGKELDFVLDIYVYSKEKLDKVVLEKSDSYKEIVPLWLEGLTTTTEVNVVEPKFENEERYIKLIVHELVHLILYKLDNINVRDKILEEGLAFYIANQLNTGMFEKVVEDINNNNIKTVDYFLDMNSINFSENNGYAYGFLLIKFLKNKYGKNKIAEYIKDKQLFRNDIDKINSEFEEYLKEEVKKYQNKNI